MVTSLICCRHPLSGTTLSRVPLKIASMWCAQASSATRFSDSKQLRGLGLSLLGADDVD